MRALFSWIEGGSPCAACWHRVSWDRGEVAARSHSRWGPHWGGCLRAAARLCHPPMCAPPSTSTSRSLASMTCTATWSRRAWRIPSRLRRGRSRCLPGAWLISPAPWRRSRPGGRTTPWFRRGTWWVHRPCCRHCSWMSPPSRRSTPCRSTSMPWATMSSTEGGVTVTLGVIGLTLQATPTMVSPSGVAGLRFEDEAATANALIPQLRAQGADVIAVVIHEGGGTTAGVQETSCAGLSGDIVPILERLDQAVDVVVSGHTHQAYVCDYGRVNPAKPFLLTSAGQYGTLLTDIQLRVDTR